MTKGTHLLRSALLALLALAVISGGSLAAGDLFDDDYKDCPYKTRLRDGQIDDLSVARDAEEEDEVNVSWAATDPATWGLGPNAYSTSLVVILDDGDGSQTKTLSLGSRKTTFAGVETGVEVTVQMAIVVDTADGDYLISDILQDEINQSVTAPAFSTGVLRVQALADPDGADDNLATTEDNRPNPTLQTTSGTLYYVGYNENFGNYRESTGDFVTRPNTARLRIGLANTELDADDNRYASDKGPYDKVDFESYIVRITDEDGDVVSEGDDVATLSSSYGDNKLVFGTLGATDGTAVPAANLAIEFSNVRLDDGPQAPIHDATGPNPGDATITFDPAEATSGTDVAPTGLSYVRPGVLAAATLYAEPPNEHRDFTVDALSSDVTYTITAWAVNDDDEVISPVAKLKVRPINERRTFTTATFIDYLNTAAVAAVTALTITEFTVLD